MTSLLRSSKFIKFFTGITRSIALNSIKSDGFTLAHNGTLVNNAIRYLATQSYASRNQAESPLEKSLRRLDMDARRSGRISLKELEDVLEEMKHSRSATSSQSLLVIRCCGNLVPEEQPEVRTKLVTEIWKTIESLGISLDISHYNALLRVYLENQHDFSPAEFLKELEVKGIEPNRVTFQRLIARYCQDGDIEGATQILQFMKEKQLPVNEGVFNSLVVGHSQSGDMESAQGILGVMEQAGLQPSAETYATLMCGHAKAGDIEAIRNILKECEAKDVGLLDRDLMEVVYVSIMNGHSEFVDELLSRMRRVGGYNQDAINLILKLINNGHEDSAYKILLTMPRPVRTDGEQMPIGHFFVRQLVKTKRPTDRILHYCNELYKNDLNPKAYLIALDACLSMTKLPEQAFAFMEVLNDMGYPPRPHFFWPLLAALGRSGNTKGMMEIIVKMFEMRVLPGAETLKDYVVPYLIAKQPKSNKGFDTESIMSTLRGCGVSTASAANALVSHLVTIHKLKEAAEVATRYRSRYTAMALQKPMSLALVASQDVDSYVTILSHICAGLSRTRFQAAAEDEVQDDESVESPQEEIQGVSSDVARRVTGSYVVDVFLSSRGSRVQLLTTLLNSLLNHGLGISSHHAEILQERLGGDLTPEISSLLTKLTSDDLTPVVKQAEDDFRPPSLEGKDLENLLAVQEAKGNPTKGLKRQLLSYYCRSKNLEEATKLLEELKADEEFVFTDGLYALMMDMYTSHDKIDEALECRKKVMENGALMEDFKVVRLADCLIKANRLEEALKVISEQTPDRKLEPRSFGYNSFCWRMLNSLAEKGSPEEIEKVFDALVKNNFIEPTNVLMGPLIKVHLEKNDIGSAMKKFEWCCETYGATPFKNQLACKLIEAEDAVSLQRLTDLSTRVHGEVNSLYDLVFSFVECGRVRQARKILETPGLRNRPQRLNSACQRYFEEGLVAPLEGLVEATKDLTHIDRSDIYFHLLKSYCKSNDANKALGLWTQMQDEDVQPSDEFLISLADLLRQNNMKIPFVEPKPIVPLSVTGYAVLPSKESVQQKVENQVAAKTPSMQRFRQAIRIGDTDVALQCKTRLEAEGKRMPVTEMSLLVEQLVKNDRVGEATAITENYLSPEVRQGDRLISPRVLRFLLNRLANLGDIDSFTNIGSFLSQDEKRLLSFDNRLCNAYIVSGKAEEFLKSLEKEIEVAKEEDLETIQDTFPRGGAIGILKSHPELLPMYESIARKYAARNIISPINVLWAHYFSTEGKESEADAIWKEYLHNSPRVMFQFVCQTARSNKDVGLIQKLIQVIKDSPISDGARGNAHSCFIDILVAEEKSDEALKALNEALKDVSLESISRGVLFRLKRAVELQGKSFPHTIPEKNVKHSSSSSSSSSSDDEPTAKRV